MNREVRPEILDALSPEDPRALASRKDMRVLNHLMGNFRWFANSLSGLSRERKILELGAGDGSLAMYLLRRGAVQARNEYVGMDLIPRPPMWPDGWKWCQDDLRSRLPGGDSKILVANHILHHFTERELSQIGSMIEERHSLEHLLICEPVRRRLHIWQLALSRVIGIRAVTLHDGEISIRAGFRQLEVCHALGLKENNWSCHYAETFLGANRIVCRRL